MGSPLTIEDLYDLLDNNQLTALITRIMKEKDLIVRERIGDEYSPDPYLHYHFFIVPGTVLTLLRLDVEYGYEPGTGLIYTFKNVVRYPTRADYEFYQDVYDLANEDMTDSFKLN